MANSHQARDGWFVMRLQDLIIALQLLSLSRTFVTVKGITNRRLEGALLSL